MLKRRNLPSPYDPTKEKHDVLVLTSAKDLYRARRHPDEPADQQKDGRDPRLFVSGLEKVGLDDDGHRKVTRIASSRRTTACFALLPIKPEPATGAFSCYLVNESFFANDVRDAPPVTVDIQQEQWVLSPKRALRTKQPGKPKQVQKNSSLRSSSPSDFVAAQDNIKVALARSEEYGFEVDASMLDFVNTWTRVDWVGALPDDRNYAAVVDKNPASREILLRLPGVDEIVRARVGATATTRVVGKLAEDLKLAMNAGGALLGTATEVIDAERDLKRELPFLDLAALKPGGESWPLLLAFPEGDVRELRLGPNLALEDRGFIPSLHSEPELYRLLRNGTVIGRTKIRGSVDVTVLNVCSLTGKEDLSELAKQKQIAGTLDFKWTPGQTLIVAFQADSTLDGTKVARERIEEAFRTWLQGTSLSATFWPQDATVFPTPGARGDSSSMPYYDILINLDSLPQYIPATVSDPARFIDFPVSEHGAYALRRRLGGPTMFLGWLPEFKANADAEPFSSARHYFESEVFLHLALHEIGHALGLPHLNQAPQFKLSSLAAVPTVKEVHDFFVENHGVQVANTFIEEELLREWEYGLDDRFNEWPDPFLSIAGVATEIKQIEAKAVGRETPPSNPVDTLQADQKKLLKDSIMVSFPALAALSRDPNTGKLNPAAIRYLSTPSRLDLDWIKKLYE